MCEEVPAVKALSFLRNDVSMTVDHKDPEETSTFRSLLAPLLVPSKPNKLDEDEIMSENVPSDLSNQSNHAKVGMKEDPEEGIVRDEGSSLSTKRFQQRAEVFETVMEFIAEDAKQPSGNLLDMMNVVEDNL